MMILRQLYASGSVTVGEYSPALDVSMNIHQHSLRPRRVIFKYMYMHANQCMINLHNSPIDYRYTITSILARERALLLEEIIHQGFVFTEL